VAAADIDPTALETHSAAVGGLTWRGDLADPSPFLTFLSERGIDGVDVVAGGPPCQPFSRAGAAKIQSLVRTGRRSEHDSRVDLWSSFVAVVEALNPRAVVLENVPDMARWNDGSVLLGILQALRERGFQPDVRILQSSDYAVPQHRARLFVVALRHGTMVWPRRRPTVTVDDAIGDLPSVPGGQRLTELPYDGPTSRFQKLARFGVSEVRSEQILDHVTRGVRLDDLEAFGLMKPGGTYRDLPDRLRRYRSDIFADKYNRLDPNKVSRTITAHIAKDGYWYIHPRQPRTLSVREAARLQTFPDRVRFAGSLSAQLRQIGNAVPPALAYAVARRVVAALQSKPAATEPEFAFADRLIAWHRSAARSFPWRETRDPWLILLAEMCLRRTRAGQVKGLFREICTIAPTPEDALRNRETLRAALVPAGLHWRTENVIAAAEAVVGRFGGAVPEQEADLLSLSGVGHYVAAAVRCFAFGRPSVLLDTNTGRIMSRFEGTGRSRWETRLALHRRWGPAGPDAAFNLALLDLGALVCTASSPACSACPLRAQCSYAKGVAG
jgi:DNA (cytosine-5)-methyltransferase 1